MKRLNSLRKYSLEWGIVLVFLLPPLGIGWLIAKGWYHFYRFFINRKGILPVTAATIFLTCLMISSIGASILLQNAEYLMITGLLIGYFGIYLHVRKNIRLTDLSRYKWIVIFGGLYICVFGNVEMFLHQHFHINNHIIGLLTGAQLLGFPHYDRLFGDAYNPNFASFLLLLAAAFLLAEILGELNKKPQFRSLVLKGVMLAAIAAALMETESRESIVTLVVIFLLFVFRYRWKIGALILFVIVLFSQQLVSMIPRMDLLNASLKFREHIWENSLLIWNQHPLFGVTPFGFQKEYIMMTGRHIAHAHNIFLAYLSDYGIVGEAAFLLLVATCVYKFFKVFRSMKTDKRKTGDLFILAFPIIPLTGLLDFPMSSPQIMFLVIILLGGWDRYVAHFQFLKKAALQVRYT